VSDAGVRLLPWRAEGPNVYDNQDNALFSNADINPAEALLLASAPSLLNALGGLLDALDEEYPNGRGLPESVRAAMVSGMKAHDDAGGPL